MNGKDGFCLVVKYSEDPSGVRLSGIQVTVTYSTWLNQNGMGQVSLEVGAWEGLIYLAQSNWFLQPNCRVLQ